MSDEQRIAVIAALRPGMAERARSLLEGGPVFEIEDVGLTRHSVYVSGDAVVFVFEGENVEALVQSLVNDPVVSASFGAWGPLIEGAPHVAHEQYFWRRS